MDISHLVKKQSKVEDFNASLAHYLSLEDNAVNAINENNQAGQDMN